MLILVMDTSTPAVTAGVYEVGADAVTCRGDSQVVDGRGHGEQLAPMIDKALRAAGSRTKDLSAVVAGLGPGPFTGLRVGLVTAASMSHALDIPSYGVCSLDALGLTLAESCAGKVVVATDARRKEVYWGLYGVDGGRLDGPNVDKPAQVSLAEAVAVAGDGALLYPEVFPGARDEPRYPSAEALARLAADRVRTGAPTETLTPLYLRRPDVHVGGRQQRL
ncbi:MAG TPA: tRNA (adenosine(37)-N6)-threonylcarbamoyltransferase complex dimerization subunit type 1 TsaB [Candidatus Stackebrandtia excrementipullorum]|nr:tRNA (adenosine(37)-N6)-threonylcarbamoyltransferase complex dimerization subunit type 1 TsaB [Candidatus Stackebrandtia excrementipullorum]